MKILHVIPFFSPKFGGSVTVPYELSKELAKRNHEVTIITSDFGFDSQYARTIHDAGVEVIPFHCRANIGLFLYTPSIKIWLKKNLKEFDIIHLHNYRSFQNIVVRSFAMKYGIPYIVQAHGSVLPFFEKQTLKKLYDFLWGYNILRDAKKVIAVSEIEADQYEKMGMYQFKIEIIPNGLDIPSFRDLPISGTFKSKHGILDKIYILYLGRIHKIKGIDLLVNVFYNLQKEFDHIILVIAGPDDGYLSDLVELSTQLGINDKILFTGPLYENEKREAYLDADILVYPTVYEIFGLVPFEAIMCGTPVIVTNDVGCGKLITTADCGYTFENGNLEDLSEKIKYVLSNKEEVESKIKKGRIFISRNLNWEYNIRKFEQIYES